MKREFLPYYLSRAVLSMVFSMLLLGVTWKALLAATGLFGLFLLYLHSGWFSVDMSHPLVPLRRDPRGLEIQRKALIAAVVIGLLVYLVSPQLAGVSRLPLSGHVALSIGVISYFIIQFVLFSRT